MESPTEPLRRSAAALQLAELSARQQEALAAAVDAAALQLAPDADWMQVDTRPAAVESGVETNCWYLAQGHLQLHVASRTANWPAL